MDSDFLDPQEQQRVKDRTRALAQMLNEWACQYPCIRTTRVPTAALVTAMALARISLDECLPAAQIILWVFGFDDQADERMITYADMRRMAEQWYLIARDGPGDGADDDELTAILIEIRRELSKSFLFESLREHWASRLRILVEAMAQEYHYALQYNNYGARALPSLDEYVRGGLNSIGFPLWGATVLMLLKDPSVMQQFEPIVELVKNAGAAARLYNDVRSFDREAQEKSLNSIFIVYHTMMKEQPSTSHEVLLAEAKQYILQLADGYAQKCYRLVDHLTTDSGQIEEVVTRVVAFHSYFYGRSQYDYHIASLNNVYECLEKTRYEPLVEVTNGDSSNYT